MDWAEERERHSANERVMMALRWNISAVGVVEFCGRREGGGGKKGSERDYEGTKT